MHCPTACSPRARARLAPTSADCQHRTVWMSKRSRSTSRCESCHGSAAMAFSMTIQASPPPTPPLARRSKHAFWARSASVSCLPCRADMALLTAVTIPCSRRPGPSGAEATLEVSTCTRGLLCQPRTATAANGSFVIAPGPRSALSGSACWTTAASHTQSANHGATRRTA